ncbi:MAG: hypothetical protein Faunusvirus32_8, partial [Faunusvirus sp.]
NTSTSNNGSSGYTTGSSSSTSGHYTPNPYDQYVVTTGSDSSFMSQVGFYQPYKIPGQ